MITVHKASGFTAEDSVDEQTIAIHPTVPDGLSVDETRQLFTTDGTALARALWETLPGGTLDVLIGELLAHRASLFRVRFPAPGADR